MGSHVDGSRLNSGEVNLGLEDRSSRPYASRNLMQQKPAASGLLRRWLKGMRRPPPPTQSGILPTCLQLSFCHRSEGWGGLIYRVSCLPFCGNLTLC